MTNLDHKSVSKVLQDNMVKLPDDYIELFNLKEGDLMAFVHEEGNKRLILVPVTIPKKPVEKESGESSDSSLENSEGIS